MGHQHYLIFPEITHQMEYVIVPLYIIEWQCSLILPITRWHHWPQETSSTQNFPYNSNLARPRELAAVYCIWICCFCKCSQLSKTLHWFSGDKSCIYESYRGDSKKSLISNYTKLLFSSLYKIKLNLSLHYSTSIKIVVYIT